MSISNNAEGSSALEIFVAIQQSHTAFKFIPFEYNRCYNGDFPRPGSPSARSMILMTSMILRNV